jgi:hypothetical protein
MPSTKRLAAVASSDTVWNLSPFASFIQPYTHARTDTHKGLLISWPILYSWYVVGEEMIGQIRHLFSCYTHVVCMCIQNDVMLFYSYAPTCTPRLPVASGSDSQRAVPHGHEFNTANIILNLFVSG